MDCGRQKDYQIKNLRLVGKIFGETRDLPVIYVEGIFMLQHKGVTTAFFIIKSFISTTVGRNRCTPFTPYFLYR
jgi:hypothetical protein